MKRRAWLLAIVATGAWAAPARQQRELMHTTVTVVIADPLAEPALTQAFEEVFAVFAGIEKTMNEWEPDSALGRINASAGGKPVASPAPLCEVIRLSLDGAKRTAGLFDPTWAALKSVWRFGDTDEPRVPSAEAVKKGCALVGYGDVELKPGEDPRDGSCQVRLRRAGMKLGLGGVVKGWGVDQAVGRLRARGLKNFFIQAGGDLYFGGKNGARAWRAGIRDPRGPPDQIFAMMEITDRAFSTSGDYEHFFVVDDVRYHHIIDLRTCWPASASRSVTVLARSATDAEFLTKSAFILGGDKGLALVESLGAAAVIVDSGGKLHVSKSIEGQLERSPQAP